MRLVLLALVLWSGLAFAAVAQSDLAAGARRLQEDLVSQRAIAVARERRLTSANDDIVLARLDVLERSVRAKALDAARTRAERDAARAELVPVIAERDRLRDEFARRDTAYAAEIAEYQRQIATLVKSASPLLQEALQRFADGDRVGAFPVIEQVMRAEIASAEAATAERNAAALRQLAALAGDMRDRGEKTTADVIAIWEEAQRKTPGWNLGWQELQILYLDAGRLGDARRAAEQIGATARSDRERAIAAADLADVLVLEGDSPRGLAAYDESLATLRRIVAAAPADRAARRDVGVALFRMSEVLRNAGQTDRALATAREAVQLLGDISAADPSDARAAREAMGARVVLGAALEASDDRAGARAAYEQGLAQARSLADGKPVNSPARRDLAVTLGDLGDLDLAENDLAAARTHFEGALSILRQQAETDPANVAARRDVAMAQQKVGKTIGLLGDLTEARRQLTAAADLIRPLVNAAPGNADNVAVLAEILKALAQVENQRSDFAAAQAAVRELVSATGGLADRYPADDRRRGDLIDALLVQGDIAFRAGDRDGAQARWRDGFERWRTMLAARHQDVAGRRSLAARLIDVGDELTGEAAAVYYRQALDLLRIVVAASPQDRLARGWLAAAASFLGGQEISGGRYDTAQPLYIEAVSTWRTLFGDTDNPSRLEEQKALFALGDLLVIRDDFDDARLIHADALALARRLHAAAPEDRDVSLALARSLGRSASLRFEARDDAAALALGDEALPLFRAAAAKAALTRAQKRDMADLLSDLARLHVGRRDGPAAVAAYREALELRVDLANGAPDDPRTIRAMARLAGRYAQLVGDPMLWTFTVQAYERLETLHALTDQDRGDLEYARVRAEPVTPSTRPESRP